MVLSKKEFEKLAILSRLRFTDEELEGFRSEMEDIIAFADTINNAVSGGTSDIKNTGMKIVSHRDLREDKIEKSLPNEKILSNVDGKDGFFNIGRCVK